MSIESDKTFSQYLDSYIQILKNENRRFAETDVVASTIDAIFSLDGVERQTQAALDRFVQLLKERESIVEIQSVVEVLETVQFLNNNGRKPTK